MMLLLRVAALVLVHGVVTQAVTVTLEAKVSVGGVKGMVTFSQASPGSAVTVSMALTGPNSGQAATWQLHTFRLNYDVMERCGEANLGPRILTSVGGSVTSGGQTVTGLELSGMDSIEGRSIAFLSASGDPVACATVESSAEYYTARAVFRKSVLGHVIFRQHWTASPSSRMTRVTVDLFSDGSESSARDLEWRITENSDCSSAGDVYNPTSATGACDSGDHASCAVGDLSGKLGNVPIGVTNGSARWTKIDLSLHLPATSSNSVSGKTLQLLVPGQASPVACATISIYAARTGVAVFDNDGVTGSITLTQPSPLDPTTTSVDLVNLRSKAGGYHVHKYPVPQRLTRDLSVTCSGAMVAGHFNPFDIVYNDQSPAAAASTEDMYEVGDLSKKYGMLNELDAKRANYTDFNLPLFGANSVLGRSLVIHYNQPGSPRWICANVLDSAPLTSALATFTFPVIGHVLLQQREGEEGETSVYYRLNYADGVSAPSQGHAWALHENNVTGDAMLADDVNSRCRTAGDVINDFGVSASGYDSQCSPSAPLRCRLGDLKGKHGAVSVRASADPALPSIGYFTDVNLPLRGPRSVLGKSLVLGAADGGSPKLACANLHRVHPHVLEARDWGQGVDFGSVTFTQQVGVVAAPTTIALKLQGVSSLGEHVAYGVKNRPVDPSPANRCQGLGGLYNPFEATPNGTTKDQMAVGDLSGKFGPLQSGGGAAATLTQEDPSLDVWGPLGIVGRAFSVSSLPGESGSGGIGGCANIAPKKMPGGKLFTAKAVFTGEVTGDIRLMQHMYPGGSMTPTMVVVNLRKASGAQTTSHNWHTHVYPVGDDAAATPGRCASTGGHYNPFKVNVQSQYIECSLDNPLRCELGDQSNKVGTYDMASGPMVASDVYLPLAGPFGVIGRSMVIHTADRGAPRLACADILPDDLEMSHTYTITTPPSMTRTPLVQKIAEALHTEEYNVAAEYLSTTASNCTVTRVYFLGMDQAMYREHFMTMLKSEPSTLGMYRPASHCATSSADAVTLSTARAAVMLILALFLQRWLQNF